MTQTVNQKTALPADIEVVKTGSPYVPISLVASDDNPSHLGTWKINENQAHRLLKALAAQLGATVVTAGQQQDLGLLVRETIAEADAQDAVGNGDPTPAKLNAHRDRMRDLRDTFRRAGVISG